MISVGIKGKNTVTVLESMTAVEIGSGRLSVYSTPSMLALIENTAFESVEEFLEPGEGTVGTSVNLSHKVASAIGSTITCETELIAIEGRRLRFNAYVYDEAGIVGEAIVERFIISNERFMKKADERLKESASADDVQSLTEKGNPRKPEGEAGTEMLNRMSESHRPVTAWGINILNPAADDNILDIGCGAGEALKTLSGIVSKGKLTGVDYSETAVEAASNNNKTDIEDGKMRIVHASVENLPFDDGTFDKIITVESFYFWPAPKNNLAEARRVLKVGGRMLVILDIYKKDNLPEHALENIKKYDLFVPGPEEFKELFKAAGFSDIKIHTREGEDWIAAEGIN